MTLRGAVDKGRAAIITIWVMSIIRTNANPTMWQITMIGIALYEVILLTLKTWRKATRKKRELQNIAIGRNDMRNVADQEFEWKMKEVI